MSNSSIFSLDQVYKKQVRGQWSNVYDVWFTSGGAKTTRWIDGVGASHTAYGYAALGQSTNTSGMDRIDFSNDTATASTIAYFSANAGGTSSKTHTFSSTGAGYVAARSPTKYEKVFFSNDTTTLVTSADVSVSSDMACASNMSYGYVGGGGGSTTTVKRLDFANEDLDLLTKGPLSITRYWFSANGNQNYGYFNSGITTWSTAYVSTIDRIDYSNDTATASVKGPNNVSDVYQAGMNSATGNTDYSWIGGGFNKTIVNRIDYSNDTATSVTKGPINDSSAFKASTGNHSYGYWMGGQNNHSDIDRIDYSNDTTTASAKGPLSAARYWQGEGGMGGGKNGNPTNIVASGPLPPFPNPTQNPNLAYPSAFGYGYVGGFGYKSTTSRIDFSNDTATGVAKGHDTTTSYTKGSTSSETHGYFLGGYEPSRSTTVTRLDYSNDANNLVAKGPLASSALLNLCNAGLHTPSYGWQVTCYPSGPVDRIDFSNDTATALNRQYAPSAVIRSGTTGNQSYGWIGGGQNDKSSVFRIDYANDTSAFSPRGNFAISHDWPAAFGNKDYGYHGGSPAAPYPYAGTQIIRIDYSNDTATQPQRSNIPNTLALSSGTSYNASYGYMAAGDPGSTSTVYRLDYANDTTDAASKGPTVVGGNRTRAFSAADAGVVYP
tara:strand:+ start:4502 stop:6487 length:1986 start_codon:yes stop_codon:yes gene_type:complete